MSYRTNDPYWRERMKRSPMAALHRLIRLLRSPRFWRSIGYYLFGMFAGVGFAVFVQAIFGAHL